MKIALLTDGIYPFVMGGIQKHSWSLLKSLLQQEHSVELFHHLPVGADFSVFREELGEWENNLRTHEVPFEDNANFPGHYLLASYQYSKFLLQVWETNEIEADLIYAQGLTGWAFVGRKAKKLDLPPVCVSPHGLNMFQAAGSLKGELLAALYRPWVRKMLRRADWVHSLGGKLTEIVENVGVDRQKILEVPIGIDDHWMEGDFAPSRQKRSFVFIGRFDPVKGFPELNEAMTNTADDPNIDFQLVGPIPDSAQIQHASIQYHGLIKDQTYLKEILQKADILVCSSYSEGMPTVILEAMASGCAIIATDVGAVRSQLSQETGWLIPPADGKALVQAIQTASQLPDKELDRMKALAQDHVRHSYNWKTIGEQMHTGFATMIPSRPHVRLRRL